MNADASYAAVERAGVVSAIGINQVIDKHLAKFTNSPEYRAIEPALTLGITTNIIPDGSLLIKIVAYNNGRVELRNKWIDEGR